MPSILFERAFHLAHAYFPQGGQLLEFGVGCGDTYLFQAEWIVRKYANSRLIGFDSFQGLPEEAPHVWRPERHRAGQFAYTMDHVKARLATVASPGDTRFSFVEGYYETSLTPMAREGIDNVIFVNIDVDLYVSTLQVLDFILPLLRPNVIIYWDDWKDPEDANPEPWGEHRAWDEWLAKHPEVDCETLEVNRFNQRSMEIVST